ncbi:peptidoglycan DD-metalloendopeptidase family protein [Micromonospora sp. KLBMP9576]|uniref:peptidoglycan DD-metalloendopeptidase family protein n=1 Tax=Micromonospora sp. KLBMP9576 TaxID=3424769 RepID=UPI003D8C238D
MRPAARTALALCAALLLLGPTAPAARPVSATVGPFLAAAPSQAVLPRTAPAGDARFRWPLDGVPRPVRRFDPPPRPWLPGHRGVDLAAAPGATVRAAGAGTVLFAGLVAGRPVVTVGHADGLRTTHEPVSPAVRPGASLAAGAALGTLLAGHPGCPAPACLHWGLRRGADYLDPLALLGLGPVRLLPLDGAEPALSAGRAAGGAAPRAARTRRGCCRPGRRAAASPARSRS